MLLPLSQQRKLKTIFIWQLFQLINIQMCTLPKHKVVTTQLKNNQLNLRILLKSAIVKLSYRMLIIKLLLLILGHPHKLMCYMAQYLPSRKAWYY